MSTLVHARLDPDTERILRRLRRRFAWSDSEIVRRGIRAVGEIELSGEGRQSRMIGVGQFASSVSDLGSNKKHLRGFGR